jgi:hypothetical protein
LGWKKNRKPATEKKDNTPMSKLARKFVSANTFTGIVKVGEETHSLSATGRNKREAEKKIREMFLVNGIPTRPNPTIDLLEMVGGNSLGYRARHPELPHTW